jgi:hypothetical protein
VKNQKIDLKQKIKDLQYRNIPKLHTNSITISFKISGVNLEQLRKIAQKEGVPINIFCKNLTLCYVDKENKMLAK